ncbi:MAG: hypothetical protein ACP5OO_04520 [Chloroflexia bacterium]
MEVARFRLRKKASYALPEICCVCGSPAGRGQIKVYGSSWLSSRLVTLLFPLCEECEAAFSRVSQRRRAGCGYGTLVVIPLLLGWAVTFFLGGGDATHPATTVGIWLLAAAGAVIVLGLLYAAVFPLLLPRQEREAYRRVVRAVRIESCNPPGLFGDGDVVLRFACEPFAALFRKQNERDLLEIRKAR